MGNLLHKTDWPIRGTGLDFIKIMAAILMLVDHIDHIMLDRTAPLMFLIGRGAYPLFAFASAAAFVRGGLDKAPAYAKSLILWGLIVVPISWMTRDTEQANILFTLAIGAGVLPFMMQIGVAGRALVYISAVLLLYFPGIVEFGFLGALAPVAFYMAMTGTKDGVFWLVITLALMNFNDIGSELANFGALEYFYLSIIALCATVIPWGVLKMSEDMEENNRRLMPKYFLHIFYPAHMIVLAVLGAII